MIKAQTTREQAAIAKETGFALFCFACKSGGTFSCDGPIEHTIAKSLIRLMGLVVADKVDPVELAAFIDELYSR